jgi:hypothetical protein
MNAQPVREDDMTTETGDKNRSKKPETLAEIFFYLSDPAKRRELEEFRKEYEAVNGPTDLTKRFTSTWPEPQQDWLLEHDSKRWFDGLPPFAQAYLRGKVQITAREGRLDDLDDELVRLYVSGQMKSGRGR